jgi:hypothetical protein
MKIEPKGTILQRSPTICRKCLPVSTISYGLEKLQDAITAK